MPHTDGGMPYEFLLVALARTQSRARVTPFLALTYKYKEMGGEEPRVFHGGLSMRQLLGLFGLKQEYLFSIATRFKMNGSFCTSTVAKCVDWTALCGWSKARKVVLVLPVCLWSQ